MGTTLYDQSKAAALAECRELGDERTPLDVKLIAHRHKIDACALQRWLTMETNAIIENEHQIVVDAMSDTFRAERDMRRQNVQRQNTRYFDPATQQMRDKPAGMLLRGMPLNERKK